MLRRAGQDPVCAPYRVFVFQARAPFLGSHLFLQGLPFASAVRSRGKRYAHL